MRCPKVLLLSLIHALAMVAEGGISPAHTGHDCGIISRTFAESSSGALRPQEHFRTFSGFVSPLPSLRCQRLELQSLAVSSRPGARIRTCSQQKLALQMTTAPAEKSKLVEAINTVESKKKEAIVWNDELLVWYAREKDAAARKSKSIVRRIAETTYHLISRLVCLLMLKFYGMVWSVLNYAMKLRPATKLPSSTVSASSSSASLGSAEVAVQEEETEVAVMAKESTSVKTEGSISVQTEVKPKGKEVGKEEVKLGFSKPASAQGPLTSRLSFDPSREKAFFLVAFIHAVCSRSCCIRAGADGASSLGAGGADIRGEGRHVKRLVGAPAAEGDGV
eukprot:2243401-Rhodomonas_salina.2